MYDLTRYWITPDGELVDIPLDQAAYTHRSVLKKLTGLSQEEAIDGGWIRVIRDDRFGNFWYFEARRADERTVALVEAFVLSPENKQTGEDVAASISVSEPQSMSFPIYWQEVEDSSFAEAAAASFRRESRRPAGYKWYELRGPSRKRGR